MNTIILVTLVILAVYLKPLIKHRFQTKKVNLKYIPKDGKKLSTTLYLKKNDPLWETVKSYRENIDAK